MIVSHNLQHCYPTLVCARVKHDACFSGTLFEHSTVLCACVCVHVHACVYMCVCLLVFMYMYMYIMRLLLL